MSTRTLPPTVWQLARLSSADATPASTDWIPATVAGAVQSDWARAHHLPDLHFGQNVRAYDGLEDFFWLYRTTVPAEKLAAGERLLLSGGGLDYHAEFRIAGHLVLTHTGLCTPFELDLTDTAPGTPLEILIHPAPKRQAFPADRSQAAHVTKPPVSYGWDWHPRLITLGLCEDICFSVRPATHLRHVDFNYTLADDFSSAHITVTVETNAPSAFTWRLRDPDGRIALEAATPSATLLEPRLWWTHDHGEPALYTLEVTLDAPGADTHVRLVGFRRVRLVMHPGGWEHPAGFPKSRSHPPVTLERNGRRLFARGTNWVAPEIFTGLITAETRRTAKDRREARGAGNVFPSFPACPTPDRPFFIYFAPGATHAPHHVPQAWIDKNKGRFDKGWDALREETLARQIKLGVVPAGTPLANKPEAIKDWNKLTADEQKLFARQMEVAAEGPGVSQPIVSRDNAIERDLAIGARAAGRNIVGQRNRDIGRKIKITAPGLLQRGTECEGLGAVERESSRANRQHIKCVARIQHGGSAGRTDESHGGRAIVGRSGPSAPVGRAGKVIICRQPIPALGEQGRGKRGEETSEKETESKRRSSHGVRRGRGLKAGDAAIITDPATRRKFDHRATYNSGRPPTVGSCSPRAHARGRG